MAGTALGTRRVYARVAGLSRKGKIAAGSVAAAALAAAAYRRRKQLRDSAKRVGKRAWAGAGRAARATGRGAARLGRGTLYAAAGPWGFLGPLNYEARKARDAARKRGVRDDEPVDIEPRKARRAAKYGVGSVLAATVAGAAGAGVGQALRPGVGGALAGTLLAAGATHAAAQALYERRERRAAARAKAGTGAATAG